MMLRPTLIIYFLLFWISTPGIGQNWPEHLTFQTTSTSIKFNKNKFSNLLLTNSGFKALLETKLLPKRYILIKDTLVAKQMYFVIYVNGRHSYDMIAVHTGDFTNLFSIDDEKDEFRIVEVNDTTDVTGDGISEIFILLSGNSLQDDKSFVQLWDPVKQTKLLEFRFGQGGNGINNCTGIYGSFLNKLQFSFFRGGFSFEEYWYITEENKSRQGIEPGLTYTYTSQGFIVDRTKNCCKLYGTLDIEFTELKQEYKNLLNDKQNNKLCCEARLKSTIASLAFRGLSVISTKEDVLSLLGPADSLLYNPLDLPWLPKYKEPVEVWLYKLTPETTFYTIFSEAMYVTSELRASP